MNSKNIKKGSVLLALILFLSFSVILVSAVPPVQILDSTAGFHMRTAAPESIKLNTPFDFHAHVFNESNGYPIITGITCYLHLYNLDGTHIYHGVDTTAYQFDYSWMIPTSNLTVVGEMPYMISCNSSTQGGFIASSIMITPDGYQFQNTLWILIVVLLISTGIIVLGFSKDDAPLVILGSFGLVFIGLWILFNGIAGLRDETTTRAIGIIVLMVAGYIGIKSSWSIIDDAK